MELFDPFFTFISGVFSRKLANCQAASLSLPLAVSLRLSNS